MLGGVFKDAWPDTANKHQQKWTSATSDRKKICHQKLIVPDNESYFRISTKHAAELPSTVSRIRFWKASKRQTISTETPYESFLH